MIILYILLAWSSCIYGTTLKVNPSCTGYFANVSLSPVVETISKKVETAFICSKMKFDSKGIFFRNSTCKGSFDFIADTKMTWCLIYIRRYINTVFKEIWGGEYSCAVTKLFVNITKYYQKLFYLPEVKLENWNLTIRTFCIVRFLNIFRQIKFVCSMNVYGGYKWRVLTPESCRYNGSLIANTDKRKYFKYINIIGNKTEKCDYVDVEAYIFFPKFIYTYELLSLCVTLHDSIITYTKSCLIKNGFNVTLLIFRKVAQLLKHQTSEKYLNTKNFIIVRSNESTIMLNDPFPTVIIEQSINDDLLIIGLNNWYKQIKGSSENSIYPGTLVYVNSKRNKTQSLKLIFAVPHFIRYSRVSCVQLTDNDIKIDACTAGKINSNYTEDLLTHTCLCQHVDAIYSIKGIYKGEQKDSDEDKPVAIDYRIYLNYFALISGVVVLMLYALIRNTALINFYPHMFIFDLKSHLTFLIVLFVSMELRSIAVYMTETDTVNCKKINAIVLQILCLSHNYLTMGVVLNVLLMNLYPVSHFLIKVSISDIVICAVYFFTCHYGRTSEVQLMCRPTLESGRTIAYFSLMSFIYGLTIVIIICCLIIPNNIYRFEMGSILVSVFISLLAMAFLIIAGDYKEYQYYRLKFLDISMLEVICVAIIHVFLKWDIIQLYRNLHRTAETQKGMTLQLIQDLLTANVSDI